MDSNPPQVCRLCLLTSDEAVNVWETFENSPIASILEKHFWFEVQEDDTMSEWVCQICWNQTKTFHHFYERIASRQRNYRRSVSDVISNQEQDSSPREEVLEPDLSTIREADQSPPMRNSRTSDDEGKSSHEHSEVDDDSDADNETLATTIDLKRDNTNSPSQEEKENARIREFFTMKCDICTDVEFETLVEAKEHYPAVHNIKGYLMCCDKKFRRRCLISNHILSHINPDAFCCEECGKRFRSKKTLKMHIANHVPLDSRAHKCSLCSSSFTKAYTLNTHMKINHPPVEGVKFPCDKCDKSFRTKSLLASHIRHVHEYSLEHVCETCARRFKTKQLLENHIIGQHSTTPKIQCNICGVWLKHELSLRKHLRLHQQDENSEALNCTICNKAVKNKAAMTSHIKTVHGERRHQCVMCDKAFTYAKNLKEHTAFHTGEHLYDCPYCEKKFNSNGNMHKHRKRMHFKEWTRGRDSTQRVVLGKKSSE